jgi:N-acetylmuramoyl-L-alanine amidase
MRFVCTSALRKWTARSLAAAVIAGVCAFAGASAAMRDPAPMSLFGVRFGGDDSQTRMVIETDRPMSSRVAPPDGDPRKIVLSLPKVAAAKSVEHAARDGGGFGLVKEWRIDETADGARLVLKVERGSQVVHRFTLPPVTPVGTFRYVIDIAQTPPSKAATADVSAAVRPLRLQTVRRETVMTNRVSSFIGPVSPMSTSAPTARPTLARRSRLVVVVDAGHGGRDPGAQSANLDEKDITLAAAQTLRRRLEREGRYKVVMTRDSDVFIPLETRVQIARKAGADLFISLHADSAGDDSGTHGASIYTLSDHGETRVTEVLGPREWFTRTGNHAGDPAVGRILLDLTQRSTLNRSAVFAGLLIDRVGEKIDLLPRTHRDAGYFVLLAPDVPAVLLEMGFISSPIDQARLTDPSERAKLANAIAAAIDAYFTGQSEIAPPARKVRRDLRVSDDPPSPASEPAV